MDPQAWEIAVEMIRQMVTAKRVRPATLEATINDVNKLKSDLITETVKSDDEQTAAFKFMHDPSYLHNIVPCITFYISGREGMLNGMYHCKSYQGRLDRKKDKTQSFTIK